MMQMNLNLHRHDVRTPELSDELIEQGWRWIATYPTGEVQECAHLVPLLRNISLSLRRVEMRPPMSITAAGDLKAAELEVTITLENRYEHVVTRGGI